EDRRMNDIVLEKYFCYFRVLNWTIMMLIRFLSYFTELLRKATNRRDSLGPRNTRNGH
uniref:Uncharacterized protein n=2 Tax=Haplochromini TaxID=319058 RepID=A0A3P9C1B6_9CICH